MNHKMTYISSMDGACLAIYLHPSLSVRTIVYWTHHVTIPHNMSHVILNIYSSYICETLNSIKKDYDKLEEKKNNKEGL